MRSLADDLRQRSDDELALLLRARPDLLHPVAPDITSLASRAGTATSIARALDALDLFTLQVAETLAALDEPTTFDHLLACFPDDLAEPVTEALATLRSLALVWGGTSVRLVRTARDNLGTYPGGLGPACAEQRPILATITPESLAATLADAPDKARTLLDQLTWGPPTGQVKRADRPVSQESAKTPLEWLLARDLLVSRGPGTVAMPREVGLALRTIAVGRPAVIRSPAWPPAHPQPAVTRDLALVERGAGQHALAAVGVVTDLLEVLSQSAPAVLRKGGMAQRDLVNTARLLDTDEESAALWTELSFCAGLLARDGDVDERWRPTPRFDDWSADDIGLQWAHLANTWWRMTRAPQIIRGAAQSDASINLLADEANVSWLPTLRHAVVQLLDDVRADGGSLDAEEVTRCLDDRQPRTASPARAAHVRATLLQAEALGITSLGVLTTAGAALLAGESEENLAQLISDLLPTPVDHVMLQGDLTAIAPGPLTFESAREMRQLADIESTGGATVYRFSEASIRRGFDAGRDAADILASLKSLSLTEVPQPLEYLINDLGRRHGNVRVGIAGCYLRCADEATAASIMASRQAETLGLTQVAANVLVSTLPPEKILNHLRDMGIAPIPESAEGALLSVPTTARRTPPRSVPVPLTHTTIEARPALIDAAIRTLRAMTPSDAPDFDSDDTTPMPATATMSVLRSCISEGKPVVMTYAGDDESQQLLITPVRLAAGLVTAMEHASGVVRTFSVARISSARPR
jgi:hypothetical protein